uniref:Uncharacterized protein n=1 Tax=Romanomermis culicivorax TaxID=13658 RepID=A0A915J8R6_ROMCU
MNNKAASPRASWTSQSSALLQDSGQKQHQAPFASPVRKDPDTKDLCLRRTAGNLGFNFGRQYFLNVDLQGEDRNGDPYLVHGRTGFGTGRFFGLNYFAPYKLTDCG